MNKILLVIGLSIFVVAQATAAIVEDRADEGKIVERGWHHRVRQRTVQEKRPDGTTRERVSEVVELGSGMHRLDPATGQFLESSSEIDIVENGAAATKGAHSVAFSADVLGGIELLTPDAQRIRLHFTGLALWDAASGDSVLFPAKSSIGELHPPNRILFRNVAEGLDVDLVYLNTLGGLSQSLIIRSQPNFSLADLNMNEATTRVLIYSGIDEAPEPEKRPRQVNDAGLLLWDEPTIELGALKIARGTAFSLGGETPGEINVLKTWTRAADGRRYLIENFAFISVSSHIRALPPAPKQAAVQKPKDFLQAKVGKAADRGADVGPLGKLGGTFPIAVAPLRAGTRMQTAQIGAPLGRGLLVDWEGLTGSTNGMRFLSGRNYYVQSDFQMTGTNWAEPCIIKVAPTNSARLNVQGVLVCLTTPTTPLIITARDDRIGEAVGTNTVMYATNYADTAIYFANTDVSDLSNVRIKYAKKAIDNASYAGSDIDYTHIQILHCGTALYGSANINLRNCLMSDVQTNFFNPGASSTSRVEHLTVDASGVLAAGSSAPSLYLTNVILCAVTNFGTGYLTNSSSNVEIVANPATIFETSVGGGHYLIPSYNPSASAVISSSLLSDFRNFSVRAPVTLTNLLTTNTTLSPVAARMSAGLLCGYAYPALDFTTFQTIISNTTVTITPGTAIGICSTGSFIALILDNGGNLVADGSPTNLAKILRYESVQENFFNSPGYSLAPGWWSPSPNPTARLRFCEFAAPGSAGCHFWGIYGNSSSFQFVDSQFHGGLFQSEKPTLYVTNCVFDGVYSLLTDASAAFDAYFQNCLFYEGTTTWFEHLDAGTYQFRDNFFYQTSFMADPVDASYNAYLTNATTFGGANELVLTNASIEFQTGSLGRWYLPTNSLLIDRGSAINASLLGFASRTTQPTEVREGTNRLDISFHYVATANGVPIDSDLDGLADYLEEDFATNPSLTDTDGDGVSDYIEVLQGRNPLAGAAADTNGVINLRVYTPLK